MPADESTTGDPDDRAEATDDDLGEGPLDPSVFEGLFADLTGPTGGTDRDGDDDNPLEAFLATPLTGESWTDDPVGTPSAPADEPPSADEELPSIDDLFDDGPWDDEPVEEGHAGEPLGGGSFDGEPADGESPVGEPLGGESFADESFDGEYAPGEPVGDAHNADPAIEDGHLDGGSVEAALAAATEQRLVDDPDATERLLPDLLPVDPTPAEDLRAEPTESAPSDPEPGGFTGWADASPAETEYDEGHLVADRPDHIETGYEVDFDGHHLVADVPAHLETGYEAEYHDDLRDDHEAYDLHDDGAYDLDHDHVEIDDPDVGDLIDELDGLDGPVMASPPIQHDPEPLPELAPVEAPAEAAVAHPAPAPARRRLTAVVLAILVGGALGIAGAVLLAQVGGGDDDGETAAAPAGPAVADDGDTAPAETEPATDGVTAAPTGLELSSLGFEPGAEPPRLADSAASRLLAEAVAQSPATPISATVRSYREPTAADDLTLSIRQAAALEAELIELGADPDQVAIVGLGRSLLSPAQPVPNFVVPSAGLGPSDLADVTRSIGPFAIGVDGPAGELRAESREALTELAQAMVDDPDQRSVTLAAYSFDQPDREANDRRAQLAADAAVAYLTASGIDPARLTVIVAGDEPYAVTDAVGNHVDLRMGSEAATILALGQLGVDELDFEEGSADLDAAGQATIDELASLIVSSSTVAVIDVHSFDGSDLPASVGLSVLRAQAIGQRLVDAGVPAGQLRLHGGASPQFRSGTSASRTVVTLLPTAG